jgi:hypothetical protein
MLSEAEVYSIEKYLRTKFKRKNPEVKYPWLNVYEWKGEVILSSAYQTDAEAFINADQSFYTDFKPYWQYPRRIANAGENDVRYVGCFDLATGNLQIRTPKI